VLAAPFLRQGKRAPEEANPTLRGSSFWEAVQISETSLVELQTPLKAEKSKSHVLHEVGSMPRPSSLWIFLALVFLIFVWSLNYVVAKVGLREVPALALGSFRLVLAGIVSVPLLFFVRTGRDDRHKVKLEISRKRRLQALWTITYLGFLNVILNQGCYTVGLNYTSVSHSSVIIACAPILILLFSWVLRLEPLTRRKIIGMALAFAGAIAVGLQAGSAGAGVLGDLLSFVAGTGFALYTVLGKRAVAVYSAIRLSLLSNIAGAVLAAPVAGWQFVALERAGQMGAIGVQGWGSIIYMAVLASAVSYVLYFWLLRYMTPASLGSATYLQPIGATLLGLLLLGEPITLRVAMGGILVIAGVYVIETHLRDAQPEEELA
jgi:drug/metabolite transporter (DMT)-like permease